MEFKREFDFVIYPTKLIITVGITDKELKDLYVNAEPGHEGEWSEQDENASFVNLVIDKNDEDRYKILWNFEKENDITIQNICHESFHITTSLLQHLNMSLGYKIGEDEHAAYIAGFAGKCVTDVICEIDKRKKGNVSQDSKEEDNNQAMDDRWPIMRTKWRESFKGFQ